MKLPIAVLLTVDKGRDVTTNTAEGAYVVGIAIYTLSYTLLYTGLRKRRNHSREKRMTRFWFTALDICVQEQGQAYC